MGFPSTISYINSLGKFLLLKCTPGAIMSITIMKPPTSPRTGKEINRDKKNNVERDQKFGMLNYIYLQVHCCMTPHYYCHSCNNCVNSSPTPPPFPSQIDERPQ